MSTPIQIDPVTLARWQTLAQKDPRSYRMRLTIFAIAGDFMLTCAQVLPWVLPIVVGVLFFPHPLLIWIGIGAAVFIVWLVRPRLIVDGLRIERHQAPELFGAIDELRAKLLVAANLEVYVDGELNAGAAEGRGLFGVLGTRPVLVLGVPLLACLSKDQLLAVIAHEFGHFSRRHGRLGGWLYRARMGWTEYAERAASAESAFERAMSWYAQAFAPRFLTMSLVHSRDSEYEADADAAAAVGRANLADALTRIAYLASFFESELGPLVTRWQAEMSEPPSDFHTRLSAAVSMQDQRRVADLLARALATQSSWHDTHPALIDRLRALDETPRLSAVEPCAGELLLGVEWHKVCRQFDKRWVEGASIDWRVEHLSMKILSASLLSADESMLAGMAVRARLRRARALRRLDPDPMLTELRAVCAAHPDDIAARFALSAALLYENDPAGVAPMESLARAHPAYAEGAYSRLAAYAERVSDLEHLRVWRARLARAAAWLREACDAQIVSIESGSARVTVLDDASRAFVVTVLRGDECAACAWLLEGQQPFGMPPATEPGTVRALLVIIDTAASERAGLSEGALTARYLAMLRAIGESYEPIMVRTYYTTEPRPRFLSNYQAVFDRETTREYQ